MALKCSNGCSLPPFPPECGPVTSMLGRGPHSSAKVWSLSMHACTQAHANTHKHIVNIELPAVHRSALMVQIMPHLPSA